jgi:hypothetical protein
MSYDKRALKILFDTYWEPSGWRSAAIGGKAETTAADFEYALKAEVMFHPSRLSHEAALKQIIALRNEISPREVGEAFIASLGNAPLALRSGLGSYAVALNMPSYPLSLKGASSPCEVCGEYESDLEQDLNVLNFERHKWGGVRHEHPPYIAFDLDRFRAEGGASPSEEDRESMRAILKAIEELQAGCKRPDLVKAVRPYLPGNDSVRTTFLAILGFAGIIRIPGHSGFFRSFTSSAQRTRTPWFTDDWSYPIRWWTGGNGIDFEAAEFWFGPL